MDIPVHNQVLWEACCRAEARLGAGAIGRPTEYFPLLARGTG